MLKQDELKVLMALFDDLTKDNTISDVARTLKQKYPQTYRTIVALEKRHLVNIKNIGKSKVVTLEFSEQHPEYIVAELTRTKAMLKNTIIRVTKKDVEMLQKNVICILFGSYANKTQKPNSDVDLLFVIPEEFNFRTFDDLIRLKAAHDWDINITPEKGLFQMWEHPHKLTVGNEILKKHIVLYGAEHYLNLLRRYYVG